MLGCAELRMRVLSSEHTPHAPYCTVFGKIGKALADGLNRLCLCAEVCNFGIIVLIASSVPELVGRAIRATVEGLGWNPRWRFIAAIAARAVPTILVSGESLDTCNFCKTSLQSNHLIHTAPTNSHQPADPHTSNRTHTDPQPHPLTHHIVLGRELPLLLFLTFGYSEQLLASGTTFSTILFFRGGA